MRLVGRGGILTRHRLRFLNCLVTNIDVTDMNLEDFSKKTKVSFPGPIFLGKLLQIHFKDVLKRFKN